MDFYNSKKIVVQQGIRAQKNNDIIGYVVDFQFIPESL